MLYLPGFVKWLGLYIWSLITVNPYDYAACLVSDLPGNSYRIVEKCSGSKSTHLLNAWSEPS